MKNLRILYFFIPALLIAGEVRAAKIHGTVSEVHGDEATIVPDSKDLPSVGDKVTFYFIIPGTQDEISVGTGKVSTVDAAIIKAKIENATGEVAKNQQVRMILERPKDPAACAHLPGSVLWWNEAAQQNSCICPEGYEWNKALTGCRYSKAVLFQWANCGRLAGSTPIWEEDNERVFCQCPPGTGVSADSTACVSPVQMQMIAQTNCSMYPGTTPVWDYATQRAGCTCPVGLQWNGTACVPQLIQQPSMPSPQFPQSSGQPSFGDGEFKCPDGRMSLLGVCGDF